MKKIHCCLFVAIICFAACERPSKSLKVVNDDTLLAKKKKPDSLLILSYKDFQISNIKLGDNSKELYKIGQADSIILKTSDFDIPDLKRYYVKKSYFEIDTDKTIYGFDIVDSSYIINPFNIKVGDKLPVVINKLHSYINPKDEWGGLSDNKLRIRIGSSDDYLIFTFNKGILDEYETWSDE